MEKITVKIEKPVNNGNWLARIEGKVVFVPGVLEGELVEIELVSIKRDFATARVISIIESSPLRVEPQCAIYTECGGCSYLHCSYEHEVSIKKQLLCESFRRIAHIDLDDMQIPVYTENRLKYRSHATVKYANGHAGFFKADSHDHVALPDNGCLLLPDKMNEVLKEIKLQTGERRIAMDNAGDVVVDKKEIVSESVHNMILQRNLLQFFQVNRFLRQQMLDLVAQPEYFKEKDVVVYVGCGVGFFSLAVAPMVRRVVGYDIDYNSIQWAKKNAVKNKIKNSAFFVKKFQDLHPVKHKGDVVIVDPPRAGLDKRTRKTIRTMQPGRIIYVSCNPVTLARDCQDFITAGYVIDSVKLLDMFPCTSHSEGIVVLQHG